MKNTITATVGNTYASKNSKSSTTVEWTLIEANKKEVSLQIEGKLLVKVIPLEMFNRNWVMVKDNSVEAIETVEAYENGSNVILDDGAVLLLKLQNNKVELYNARKNKRVQVRKIYNEVNGVKSSPYFKLQKRVCFLKDVK